MALYQYDRGALFLEGSCLAEWQGGTVNFPGTHTPVETMANGGTRRGFVRDEARGMDCSFTIRIRRDGSEFQDLVDDWDNGTIVSVHVWIGGVQFGAQGVIDFGALDLKEGTLEVNFMGAAPQVYS